MTWPIHVWRDANVPGPMPGPFELNGGALRESGIGGPPLPMFVPGMLPLPIPGGAPGPMPPGPLGPLDMPPRPGIPMGGGPENDDELPENDDGPPENDDGPPPPGPPPYDGGPPA